jgi:5-methylcytosine-specific restriction endonuclease McrA
MRLCSGAGCGRKIEDDVRFCDECKPVTAQSNDREHKQGYTATMDELRTGKRWQTVRDVIIKRFPFCCKCEIAMSAIVDHVVPAEIAIAQAQVSGKYPYDKYAGYYLKSNLQGLCRKCHHIKTVADKEHIGPWRDVVAQEAKQIRKVYSF